MKGIKIEFIKMIQLLEWNIWNFITNGFIIKLKSHF